MKKITFSLMGSILMLLVMTVISEAKDMTNLSAQQKVIIPIAAFTAKGDMPGLETLDTGLTINEVKEVLV